MAAHDDPRPLTVGSLFSGVGGMDLGFSDAGWHHAFLCEIDPFCREVLRTRFPDVPVYEDVHDVGADAGTVSCVCGGFPCQDISLAGKRAGLEGKRSGLWWEFARVIDAVRPRSVVIENVEGLFSSGTPRGSDFAAILDTLAELGYSAVTWRMVDAQHFPDPRRQFRCVPQRRRRVFVCAIADDDSGAGRVGEVLAVEQGGSGDHPTSDPSWPLPPSDAGAGADGGRVVGTLSARGYTQYTDQEFMRGGQLVTHHDLPIGINPSNTDVAGTLVTNAQGGLRTTDIAAAYVYRKSRRAQSDEDVETWVDDSVSNTLNTFDTGDVRATQLAVSGSMVRRLTPLEFERLTGLPDNWTDVPWRGKGHAPDSRRYAGCGNAVVAPVAYWIAARLAEVLR